MRPRLGHCEAMVEVEWLVSVAAVLLALSRTLTRLSQYWAIVPQPYRRWLPVVVAVGATAPALVAGSTSPEDAVVALVPHLVLALGLAAPGVTSARDE